MTIDKVKLESLNIDVDATLEALNTQYQFCADAIIPRHSDDAPDSRQLSLIRNAHLNISRILREYKNAMLALKPVVCKQATDFDINIKPSEVVLFLEEEPIKEIVKNDRSK